MYSLELRCELCGHIVYMTGNELWRIVLKANELEIQILSKAMFCNICEETGPIHLRVMRDNIPVVFFEKIISPTSYIKNTPHTTHKPTMDNPCITCCATGTINVQYKAHKKEGSFKGVLVEECPICSGRGYFK